MMMDMTEPITRRASLRRLLHVSGTAALSLLTGAPLDVLGPARAEGRKKRFLIEAVGQSQGYGVKALTQRVFEAAGGLGAFISKGDVVVIKPNISWARRPELAATTHPEVLESVIELCYGAGAKKVRIADHTINDARRCFAITGALRVAKKTRAELVFPRASLMKEMKIHGERLDTWPVFVPLLEADKIINLPVAKDHVLSTLTLGMKNWIGAVGGRRNVLHQDIHHAIVDLAQFFRPTLTLIDAVRIMKKNGPTGGSLSDVEVKDTLILSDDPVAADALAATLFHRRPEQIGFIRLAQKRDLGTYQLQQLQRRKVVL